MPKIKGEMIMNSIQQYIMNNMKGKHKSEIEDYILSFYIDKLITEEELNYLFDWLDQVYDLVLSW